MITNPRLFRSLVRDWTQYAARLAAAEDDLFDLDDHVDHTYAPEGHRWPTEDSDD